MAQVVRFRSRQQHTEREASPVLAQQLSLLPPDMLDRLPGEAWMLIFSASLDLRKTEATTTRPPVRLELVHGGD